MFDKLGKVGAAAVVGAGLVAGVTAPASVLPAYTAEVQLATATAIFMGGLGYETVTPEQIASVLNGKYKNDIPLGVGWPGENAPFQGTKSLNYSVQVGIDNMLEAINNTPGVKIVGGASGSTLVVDEVMARLANSDIPADQMSFVVLGDANRGVFKQIRGVTLPIFEYTVPAIPVTKYDVLVVKGEYDGLGDWPDRSWNLLADLNAMAGTSLLQQVIPQNIVDALKLDAFGSVHYDAMFADLSTVPPQNITVVKNAAGGTTTTYLVPTPDLPLLRPLKPLGVPQPIIDALETVLRPIIDSAYIRNDTSGTGLTRSGRTPAATSAVTAASASPAVPPAAAVRATSARSAAAKATVKPAATRSAVRSRG